LALYSISSELVAVNKGHVYTAKGQLEGNGWRSGGRSLDFTEPLSAEERDSQRTTLAGLGSWLLRSLELKPPPGLRHTAAPASGALARNRVLLEQVRRDKTRCCIAVAGFYLPGSPWPIMRNTILNFLNVLKA
jgi:hypothetical protein